MKTAITVLQEMMVKLGRIPEYKCISQSGPHHQVTFEFMCVAEGISVTATARSKKEAKQEAARRMLLQLRTRGYDVPHPYDTPRGDELNDMSPPSPIKKPALEPGPSAGPSAGPSGGSVTDARSYVALLKELCEQYHLGAVEYTLTADTGPAHLRRFVVRAQLGQHAREAAAGTKKAARQLAAEQLYGYLRANLATTKDFCEEEALNRALEKAMERYVETQDSTQWRPDLSQKVSEFHIGLCTYIDADKRRAALEALSSGAGSEETRLASAVEALALRMEQSQLGPGVALLTISPTHPTLVFAGENSEDATRAAARHLKLALKIEA